MTLAPSLARARAMPSPIPEVEPVTTAVLPFNMRRAFAPFTQSMPQLADLTAAIQQATNSSGNGTAGPRAGGVGATEQSLFRSTVNATCKDDLGLKIECIEELGPKW